MRRFQLEVSFAVLIAAFTSSCAVTQKYTRPTMPTPPAYQGVQGSEPWQIATPGDGVMKGKWWEIYNDADLNALEEKISVSNYNVKELEAEFRESVALIAGARAGYYPTLSTAPSISQSDRGANSGGGKGGSSTTFSLPFSVSWVPDLWNRVGLAVDLANANAQLSAANLENLRLSLQATLADDYFSLRGNDAQGDLLRDNIRIYQDYLKLTNDRYNGGVAALSDVALAETQLYSTQAQEIDLRTQRAQFEHAIAVITGQAPSGFSILHALTVEFSTTYGVVGQPYNASFITIGGVAPYNFSITQGTLPAGLALNPATGAITGTPTAEVDAPAPNSNVPPQTLTVTVADSATPRHTATAVGGVYVAAAPDAANPGTTDQPPISSMPPIDYSSLAPPPIPIGIPSTLLQRRPDIAGAERSAAAANVNIGIARTAWYPSLTLGATAGLSSGSLLNLLTWGSRVWTAGPSLAQTILDFGKRRAQLHQTEEAYDAQANAYRETVLSAFQQVEDNLSALRTLAEEAAMQEKAVAASSRSLDLEIARYKAGTDSALNVITTQQIELTNARTAVTLHYDRMTASVGLILALGGGWDDSTLPTPAQLKSPDAADSTKTVNVAQPKQ